MIRSAKVSVVLIVSLGLAACGMPGTPGGDPGAPASGSAAPTASPSASETPDPTAEVDPPLVLAPCDSIFTAAELEGLLGSGFTSLGDRTDAIPGAGYGSSLPNLIAIYQPIETATNCTWVLGESERGATLSVIFTDRATRAAAEAALAPIEGVSDGLFATIYQLRSTEDTPSTEAYIIGNRETDLIVSAYDSYGSNALSLAQVAYDRTQELNPWYFGR